MPAGTAGDAAKAGSGSGAGAEVAAAGAIAASADGTGGDWRPDPRSSGWSKDTGTDEVSRSANVV
ncbi:hypothetical protein OSI84_02180 [Mycobacterium ulcerans]